MNFRKFIKRGVKIVQLKFKYKCCSIKNLHVALSLDLKH